MFETVWVQGVEYPEGHKNFPMHSSMPGGPLVELHPGSRQFIGWRWEAIEKPDPLPDGSFRQRTVVTIGERGKQTLKRQPVVYKWVYDPTPVKVTLSPENDHIRKAIRARDLITLTDAEAEKILSPRKKRGGGE